MTDRQEAVRKQEEIKIMFRNLKTMLENHDWFYAHSDDTRAYDKGALEDFSILKQANLIESQGYDGHRFVKAYRDINFNPANGLFGTWELNKNNA